jgi:hypothetical protein
MATYNYRTIKNIIADLSKNALPIYAHGHSEKEAIFDKFKTLVESDARLTAGFSTYRGSEDPDWVKCMRVFFKNFDKNYSPMPSLRFDTKGRLCFDNYYADTHQPIDFYTFQQALDAVFDILEIDEADKLKKQKMRDLKAQGILARLTDIAKEDGFKFHYEQLATRINVTIHLPHDKILTFNVLFSNFQETMQKIRSFIQQSRALAEMGVPFIIEKAKR